MEFEKTRKKSLVVKEWGWCRSRVYSIDEEFLKFFVGPFHTVERKTSFTKKYGLKMEHTDLDKINRD